MSNGTAVGKTPPQDLFFLLSHSAIGLVAAFGENLASRLNLWPRAFLLVTYVAGAYWIYKKLKRSALAQERHEISSWSRSYHLVNGVLDAVGEFLKERYIVDTRIAAQLNQQVRDGTLTAEALGEVVKEADALRRTEVTRSLAELVHTFKEDSYLKPGKAMQAIQDIFKVSFYDVRTVNGEEALYPKWRCYPNEGEPRTQKFSRGQGAAGKAWAEKRTFICETGGEDLDFEDMHGGKQKELYASMICVPAIINIPQDRVNEVYGILTIDSNTRRHYFQKSLHDFWATLLQPICNLLIYCDRSQRAKLAVSDAVAFLATRTSGSSAAD
jgi:hypothetical protein